MRLLNLLADAARHKLIGYDFARDAVGAAAAVEALQARADDEPIVAKFLKLHAHRLPRRGPRATMPPQPWPAIERRNLLFYLLPLRNPANVWQWHVAQLRRFLPLFNGRRIVTIATREHGCTLPLDAAELVKAEFGADAAGIEFLERPNDSECWETAPFREMLAAIASTNPAEATFYFHAKGVRRPNQSAIRPWCEAIYRENLERSAAAIDSLRRAKACGMAFSDIDPTGKSSGEDAWHFSGTGFWFRHDALFGAAGWEKIDNHTHAVEAYLATRFAKSEVHCLAREAVVDCYDPATWTAKDDGAPRASIIVTARNYGRFLRDCLESCFWQERPAAEVIYCDDASDDDSLAVAERFVKDGLRIVPLEKNLGVANARNHAAALSTGDALLFLDGDNILPKNYLAKMAAALDYRTPFVYGDLAFFGQEAVYHRQPEWQDFDLWVENHCDTCSLIRRDAFEAAGGWIAGPWAAMEDYHLFLRLSCFGAAKRADTGLGYRKHGLSLTAQSERNNNPAALHRAYERIQNDAMRWAVERFGRLPTRGERDLGVLAAAKRELR